MNEMTTHLIFIPPGLHLMSLATSAPTKDGSSNWMAYLRRNPLGQFRGGMGWTPQEAIDNAHRNLLEALAAEPEPTYNEPRITINLDHLLRKP